MLRHNCKAFSKFILQKASCLSHQSYKINRTVHLKHINSVLMNLKDYLMLFSQFSVKFCK